MIDFEIKKAEIKHFEDCKEAILKSEIGEVYYLENPDKLFGLLLKAIENGEVYVAEKDNEALGLIRFSLDGMFSSFPYLRTIAIKKEYRGQGIGKALLIYFEKEGFKSKNKVFLLVSDFNEKAKVIYESLGYKKVGQIPNIAKEGISEYLMMKEK